VSARAEDPAPALSAAMRRANRNDLRRPKETVEGGAAG
jgi:hypothetical protein